MHARSRDRHAEYEGRGTSKKREKKKRRRKVWGNTIPFFSFAWKMRLDLKVGIDKKKSRINSAKQYSSRRTVLCFEVGFIPSNYIISAFLHIWSVWSVFGIGFWYLDFLARRFIWLTWLLLTYFFFLLLSASSQSVGARINQLAKQYSVTFEGPPAPWLAFWPLQKFNFKTLNGAQYTTASYQTSKSGRKRWHNSSLLITLTEWDFACKILPVHVICRIYVRTSLCVPRNARRTKLNQHYLAYISSTHAEIRSYLFNVNMLESSSACLLMAYINWLLTTLSLYVRRV